MLRPFPALTIALAALGLPASLPAVAAPATAAVQVTEAWVSEAPPTARNNAAYLTVTNGARQDTLLGVSTPAAAVAEIHDMKREGGVLRMQPLKAVELAPRQVLTLAPGGRHIMLIDMKQALKAGDTVPLTLRFRRAGAVTVQAVVRPLVVEEDHSHHHHH